MAFFSTTLVPSSVLLREGSVNKQSIGITYSLNIVLFNMVCELNTNTIIFILTLIFLSPTFR